MERSTPDLFSFVPVIPYQRAVLELIRNDFMYERDGVLEVLLSGSVGCLREDVPVLTASGEVPIADITSQDFVLGRSDRYNRFAFGLNSGAFVKGKDCLYRVISERGEFVAAGNHLISTSPGNYESVYDLFLKDEVHESYAVQPKLYHVPGQLLSRADVLHCWQKLANLINHCVERIYQCDPQLLSDLNVDLSHFRQLNDAREYGLFFCSHKFSHKDDQSEQESKRDRISESTFPQAMHRLICLAGNIAVDEEVQDVVSKRFESSFENNLTLAVFEIHICHPKVLLSFLQVLCPKLDSLLRCDVGITNTTITRIERLSKQEWYWDIQVPNMNTYVSCGLIHHNSAKSILMAHVAVTHCLLNRRARFLIGRRAMPDLRSTLFVKILEHIDEALIEGHDYEINRSELSIRFRNGSEIISRSWADNRIMKVRSLELSGAAIEETVENDDRDFYDEIKMRVGRLTHVREHVIIQATNPGAPSHWLYDDFIARPTVNKYVFYSVTTDNPFLPVTYIDQLKRDLDPKLARRMIYGEWLEITKEVVYYAYDKAVNFIDRSYKIDLEHPVLLSWDFNIGQSKPMSVACCQFINDTLHIFNEVVIEGMRTEDSLDELSGKGLLDLPAEFVVHGDATGKHNDTRNRKSDYQIIDNYLANYRTAKDHNIRYRIAVGLSNPPVRRRHNTVNAYCKSESGHIRLFVYRDAPTADKAMRLTSLKQGGQYCEDDSKPFQHIGTAIGYCLCTEIKETQRTPQRTIEL